MNYKYYTACFIGCISNLTHDLKGVTDSVISDSISICMPQNLVSYQTMLEYFYVASYIGVTQSVSLKLASFKKSIIMFCYNYDKI